MKINIKRVLAFGSLITAMALTACSVKNTEPIPVLMEPPSNQTEASVVYQGDLSEIWLYDGWVETEVEELSFETGGTLTDITVSIGDVVGIGDVIAYMEDKTLTAKLEDLQKEAEKQKEGYEYQLKLLDYEIQLGELDDHNKKEKDSEQNLKIAKLKRTHLTEERELKLRQIREKIKVLEEEAEKLKLTASVSGRVVYTNHDRLKEAIEGGTVIVGISKDSLYLRSQYVEPDKLQNASKLYALIGKEKIELENIPYKEQELMILQAKKEELKSTFAIHEKEGNIKAGDYGCIVLETPIKKDVLLIPIESVHKEAPGYEYVNITEQGKTVKRRIKTGSKDALMIEVVEGLKEGEEVNLESIASPLKEEIEGKTYYGEKKGTYTEEFSISGLESVYLESDFISPKEPVGEFLRYTKGIGDEVKKGDILAEYNLPYDEIKIEEHRLLYERAADNYKAEKEVRYKRLKELKQGIERMEHPSYEREKEEIILKIEEEKYKKYCKDTEEAILIQKNQLDEMENLTKVQYLYSTMDGVIQNQQPLSSGDPISLGQGIIYLLNPDSFVWVVNNMSQNLKYNMEIQIEDPLSEGKTNYKGRIIAADNIMSNGAKTSIAYIKLEDEEAVVQKNTALLKAITKSVSNVIVLESNMVVKEDKDKFYVYVSQGDKVGKRPVMIKGNGEHVWVYKGLSDIK